MLFTGKRTSSLIVRGALTISIIFIFSTQAWSQAKPQASSVPKSEEHAKDRQVLEKGKSIERVLAVGDVQSYEMVLTEKLSLSKGDVSLFS